jgi:formate hydrogenlyase transcriptional activator
MGFNKKAGLGLTGAQMAPSDQRDILLALSMDIATIKQQEELIISISDKLKAPLGFSHISICLLNDEKTSFSIFLFDPESKSRLHPHYTSLKTTAFPIHDGYTQSILESAEPININFEKISSNASLPPYLSINRDSGIVQMIAQRICRGNQPCGFLLMFFEHPIRINTELSTFISGIGYLISTGVSNILADQEVKRLLNTKSKLLQFGIDLRTETNAKKLSATIAHQFLDLFGTADFIVSILSEDKRSHSIFFHNENSINIPAKDHDLVIDSGIFERLLMTDEPVVFDLDTFLTTGGNPMADVQLSVKRFPKVIGTVMKLGTEVIGFILFFNAVPTQFFNERQLLNSLNTQIAMVAVNSIAIAKVKEQIAEIAIYKQQLEQDKTNLAREIRTFNGYTEIIGKSNALKKVLALVSNVSTSQSTVLILGETGTGKELIARAIHNNSPRKDRLMIRVNCAALPTHLIESELFGHEKGSFTGAFEQRLGKFELADGGTVFLDEIGELPLEVQAKLLRVLQEKEIERIGGNGPIRVNVRIIAATNRNLQLEVEAERFRKDLFYRLNIFPIVMPPLRTRREDLNLLLWHFIGKYGKKLGRPINSVSERTLKSIQAYPWPGNIRELEHWVERSLLLAETDELNGELHHNAEYSPPANTEDAILKTIDENEIVHIKRVLHYCGNRVSGRDGAAEILGVPPSTLNSRIKRLGIKK